MIRSSIKLPLAVMLVLVAGPQGLLARCLPPSPGKPVAVSTPEGAVSAAKDAWESISSKATSAESFKRESVTRFEPYTATLRDGVWYVVGTIPVGYRGRMPKALVCESDGSVEARESIQ